MKMSPCDARGSSEKNEIVNRRENSMITAARRELP